MTNPVTVEKCSGCRGRHVNVWHKKLMVDRILAGEIYTHYFTCPETKDPVFIRESHHVL